MRARLALGVLVLRGCNLLLLDEPINHLDIPSRENFERALATYEGTVMAVVHDRYFIEHFSTGVWTGRLFNCRKKIIRICKKVMFRANVMVNLDALNLTEMYLIVLFNDGGVYAND